MHYGPKTSWLFALIIILFSAFSCFGQSVLKSYFSDTKLINSNMNQISVTAITYNLSEPIFNSNSSLSKTNKSSSDSTEVQDNKLSNFSFSVSYDNHSTYRARDNGETLRVISPSVTYQHSLGFGASLTGYWIQNKANKKYDETDLSLFYDLQILDNLAASINYTHFWFSDSSSQAKSVFSNYIELSLSYNINDFEFGLAFDSNIGSKTETTFNLSASYKYEIEDFLSSDNFYLEPEINAIFGGQDEVLTQQRKAAEKKNAALTTTQKNSTSFSVLGYIPSISATYETGDFSIKPSVELIIPLNINDNSTKNSFVNFGLTVEYNF